MSDFAPNADPYPSLDVVRSEVDLRLREQERHGTAFDTRAGLILGFAGVLIGLARTDPSAIDMAASVTAAAAGLLAGSSLTVRQGMSLDVRALRDGHLRRDATATKLHALDAWLWISTRDEHRLLRKARLLVLAGQLLAVSASLTMGGTIVEFVR